MTSGTPIKYQFAMFWDTSEERFRYTLDLSSVFNDKPYVPPKQKTKIPSLEEHLRTFGYHNPNRRKPITYGTGIGDSRLID